MNVDWDQVWRRVADEMRRHVLSGRAHLLTEDTVRMCAILALQAAGVAPARLAVEVPVPELGGGKLDLVVDGLGETVIELKFPRDSRTGISPDTMTLGELVRDFLRVAVVPARDRWVVQVVNVRLQRYLSNLSGRYQLQWAVSPGDRTTWERTALELLPKTALEAIGTTAWMLPVVATCVVVEHIDSNLSLFAHRVESPQIGSRVAALQAQAASTDQRTRLKPAGPPRASRQRSPKGARAEILDAIGEVGSRTGNPVVSMADVLEEMRRRGTQYADSTVRTMVSSHLCADSQGPGIDPYDDLERVGRGLYRLRERRDR